MERLILLLHTVPYDNLPAGRYAVAGGIPVGVEGRGGRGGLNEVDMVLCLVDTTSSIVSSLPLAIGR
jgi:hypothetical protein